MLPVLRTAPAIALCALLVDLALGDPAWFDRTIGHPVRWLGAAISDADRRLNHESLPEARRRLNGLLGLGLVVAPPVLLAGGLQRSLLRCWPRWIAVPLLGLLASPFVAQRSLAGHVRAVGDALAAGGPPAGRRAVARIVGRDTDALDESAILRAAIESLAENFSDAVVAPLLWGAAFGLPGLVFHKAVNTADSMIGHRTPRHAAYGRAAARLDDLVNLPASRLSALLLGLSGAPERWGVVLRVVRRDAPRHRSPNAGWPEAAMAAVLDLRLAGPRSYRGQPTGDPPMGDGRDRARPADLRGALGVFRRATGLAVLSLALGAALASVAVPNGRR